MTRLTLDGRHHLAVTSVAAPTSLHSPRTAPTTALHIRLDWNFVQTKERRFQLVFATTHSRFSEANCEAVEALQGTSSSTTHALHFRTAPHRTEHRHHPLFHFVARRCRLVVFAALPLPLILDNVGDWLSSTACLLSRSIARPTPASIPSYFPLSTQTPPVVGSAPQSRAHRHLLLGTSTRRPGTVSSRLFPPRLSSPLFLLRHSRDIPSERRRAPPECSSFDTLLAHICLYTPTLLCGRSECAFLQSCSNITVIGRSV